MSTGETLSLIFYLSHSPNQPFTLSLPVPIFGQLPYFQLFKYPTGGDTFEKWGLRSKNTATEKTNLTLVHYENNIRILCVMLTSLYVDFSTFTECHALITIIHPFYLKHTPSAINLEVVPCVPLTIICVNLTSQACVFQGGINSNKNTNNIFCTYLALSDISYGHIQLRSYLDMPDISSRNTPCQYYMKLIVTCLKIMPVHGILRHTTP